MPCLFAFSSDEIVVSWVHEAILVNPKLVDPPTVELFIDGFIKVGAEGAVLGFTHRGDIACPALASAWPEYVGAREDWLINAIGKHHPISIEAVPKKKRVRLRFTDPLGSEVDVEAIPAGPEEVELCGPPEAEATAEHAPKPVCRRAKKDDPDSPPIYSMFWLRFRHQGPQVFRVRFATAFGLVPALRQISVQIEGPGSAIAHELRDVREQVTDESYKRELLAELSDMYDNRREGRYMISVIAHPLMAMNLEHFERAVPRADFSVDAKPPTFVGGNSPARSLGFDCERNDFRVKVTCDAPSPWDIPLSEEAESLLEQAQPPDRQEGDS